MAGELLQDNFGKLHAGHVIDALKRAMAVQ